MSEHLTPDPIVCLEWPLANEATEKVKSKSYSDIVTATGNQTIVFPHVDSCVAVVMVLKDGSVVGGHATVMPPVEKEGKLIASDKFGCQESLEDMLARMKGKCGGEDNIAQIVFAGGYEWMTDAAREAEKLRKDKIPVKTVPTGISSDIFIDLGTRSIKMQKWQKDTTRLEHQAPVARTTYKEESFWDNRTQ